MYNKDKSPLYFNLELYVQLKAIISSPKYIDKKSYILSAVTSN